MLHAGLRVVVHVAQLPNRVRRLLRHRRCGEEVVRRGSRCLEEQPFHRPDAAIGPVRQQHQRHRGAVLAVVTVVLPQRAPTTAVGADVAHRGDEFVVLGVLRPPLVAAHVVPGPPVRDGTSGLGTLAERTPCVHRGLAVRDAPAARERLVHPAEHQQARQRDRCGGDGPLDDGELRRGAAVPSGVHQPGDQLERTDHHQQVSRQVDERQQTRIPQQPDERQAVTGQVDQRHERQADQPDRGSGEVPAQHHRQESHHRERTDDEVERRREREEHVPERVVRSLGTESVLHVGHELVTEQERPDPPRRQQQCGDAGRDGEDESEPVEPDEAQDDGADGDEDQHDAV